MVFRSGFGIDVAHMLNLSPYIGVQRFKGNLKWMITDLLKLRKGYLFTEDLEQCYPAVGFLSFPQRHTYVSMTINQADLFPQATVSFSS